MKTIYVITDGKGKREVLDKRLEPLLGKFSANDLYQVVMAIAPNSDACESLAKQLAAITGVNGCD
jgi:hypothetical protein